MRIRTFTLAAFVGLAHRAAFAQGTDQRAAVITVADSALAAITRGDAITYRVRTRAGQPPVCEKHPSGPPSKP